MTVLLVLATIFGTLSGLGNFPQAYRIFRRKSAKDISITAYAIFFVGAVIWIFYGIEIKSFPVVIANIFGIINIGLVIVGWFMYGR